MLLETARQHTPRSKTKKKRIAPGAEVITLKVSIGKKYEDEINRDKQEGAKQKNTVSLKKSLVKEKESSKQNTTSTSKNV